MRIAKLEPIDNAVLVRSRREQIFDLQRHMVDTLQEDEKVDPPVNHYFASGVYGREIFLPKGIVIVGKIHKYDHLNIISYGKVRVATDEGIQEFEGPVTFTSTPGCKRVVYALEDTLWTTIHVTDKTDLDEIEQEVIAETYDDLPWIEG